MSQINNPPLPTPAHDQPGSNTDTGTAPAPAPAPAPSGPAHPSTDPSTALPPPTLVLTKSVLRPFHPSDAPAVQRAADSPAVARYMSNRFASPYTLDDARRWVAYAMAFRVPGATAAAAAAAAGDAGEVVPSLAVCDRASGAVVGGIGILKARDDVEAHCFEVGFWLGEASWGRGIMSEACRAYARWVFGVYPGVDRLEAGVFEGNGGSVKVLERAGFVHEGTRRRAGVKHGVVFDILVYGLLREECDKLD